MSLSLSPSSCVETFDTAILTRAISPERKPLPREVAQEILAWDFPPEDKERMAQLSEKARAGELSANEEAQIDSYVRVGHIINLMQAKARLAIKQAVAH